MERSKGLILIVVGLAAVLIIWKVGFKPVDTPAPQVNTANQQKNPVTPNPQVTSNTPGQRNPQSGRTQQGNDTGSRSTRGNRGDYSMNTDFRGMTQPFENTGLKIALPDKLSDAELKVLYEEYVKISGGTGRGGRGPRGGGMMGGGMMGGGMMGGGPGGMMGGDMGGFGG